MKKEKCPECKGKGWIPSELKDSVPCCKCGGHATHSFSGKYYCTKKKCLKYFELLYPLYRP